MFSEKFHAYTREEVACLEAFFRVHFVSESEDLRQPHCVYVRPPHQHFERAERLTQSIVQILLHSKNISAAL
jgi:hypothetical protein